MSYTDWSIKGPQFASCNCAWGCPCQFNALPTHGDCRGMGATRIDEGHFGDVRLDGLCWINTFCWPGPIHEGRGECQAIIDERADEEQRAALLAILSGEHGEPGATIYQVFSTVIDTYHPPLFLPIAFEVDVDNRTAHVRVPGVLDSLGQPIRNPVTGDEHRAHVTLPGGFEFTEAEFGSGTTKASAAVKLDFEDSYGQFAMIHLTARGPVR